MFNNSKYTKWYYQIIANAKSRNEINTYTEKHHIVPRSMGGNNQKSNLVVLTYREHFLCHWLLTKMVITIKHFHGMKRALGMMSTISESTNRPVTSWQFDVAKRIRKNIPMSEEQKEKLRNRVRTQGEKDKISASQKKRFENPEAREILAAKKRGTKITLDHAAKLKASHFKHCSDSHKAAVSKAKTLKWKVIHNDNSYTEISGLKDYAKTLNVSYTLLHKIYLTQQGRAHLNIYNIEKTK